MHCFLMMCLSELFLIILQAFLEMGTEEAAITMVNYYATVTPHVRNVPVYIQYSNHKELKTDAGNQVSNVMSKVFRVVSNSQTLTLKYIGV